MVLQRSASHFNRDKSRHYTFEPEMANCARVIITPMSERPHPERRPVDQFRPVNQVSQAREKVRRAVEDNLYASDVLI